MKRRIYCGSAGNRIKELLLSDRLGSADGYSELIASDVAQMLEKYISIDKSEIRVSISRVFGNRYRIEIIAETEQIKPVKFI